MATIRQFANRNGGVITAAAVVLLLICGWFIVRQARSMFSSNLPGGSYYTTDDGKSWFKDDFNKTTPFMVDGKEAVEAHVFSCDGKEFVAYMTRFNPQAKKAIDEFSAARAAGKPVEAELAKKMSFASMAGKEYKRPGEGQWIPQGQSSEISKMTTPKCDDNSAAVKEKL